MAGNIKLILYIDVEISCYYWIPTIQVVEYHRDGEIFYASKRIIFHSFLYDITGKNLVLFLVDVEIKFTAVQKSKNILYSLDWYVRFVKRCASPFQAGYLHTCS